MYYMRNMCSMILFRLEYVIKIVKFNSCDEKLEHHVMYTE